MPVLLRYDVRDENNVTMWERTSAKVARYLARFETTSCTTQADRATVVAVFDDGSEKTIYTAVRPQRIGSRS